MFKRTWPKRIQVKLSKSYSFLLFAALLISGCTREISSSKLKIKLPGSASSAKMTSEGFSGSDFSQSSSGQWGQGIPSHSTNIKCYAVAISAPDLDAPLNCKNASDASVMQVHKIYGLFPAGADLELTVPSGNSRKLVLIGFNASSLGACVPFNALSKPQLSPPSVVGSVVTDINSGTNVIEITASMTGSTQFDACVGPDGFTGGTPSTPNLSFSGTAASVGESASSVNMPITLSAAATSAVTVNYTVSGTATSSTDFTISSGNSSGAITISAGASSGNIVASIVDDVGVESAETIIVTITSVTNATLISPSVFTVTINDNDSSNPTVEFTSASAAYGENSGSINLPISVSTPPSVDVDVNYTVSGNATGSGVDHNLAASGTYTITAGSSSGSLPVNIINDSLYETTESFTVTINSVTNATLGSQATYIVAITNDDTQPTVSLSTSAGFDAEGSTVPVIATLNAVSGVNVTVNVSVSAMSPDFGRTDYKLPDSMITIPAGSMSGSVSLNIYDDKIIENDDDYQITIATPTGATIGTSSAVRQISSNNNMDLGAWDLTLPSANAPSATYNGSAVWTGARVVQWGGATDASNAVNTGSMYSPATNTWTTMSTSSAASARSQHTAVWTGEKMIVWGGVDSSGSAIYTGGIYNPSADAWAATSNTSMPTARFGHTSVWTGKDMVVWGGTADGSAIFYQSGSRYTPYTNTWSAMSTASAPASRGFHSAVWTGQRMIVWGGLSSSGVVQGNGGIYDPTSNTWASMASSGAPIGRSHMSYAWTGTKLIVWGGNTGSSSVTNSGAMYDPMLNTWTAMSTANAPVARQDAKAVWTGTHFIVWGGHNGSGTTVGVGGIYDPASNAWATITTTSEPTGRYNHNMAWMGARTYMFGGKDSGGTALGYGVSKLLNLSTFMGRVRQITAGANHSCALLDHGAVKCWGFNMQGQAGLSTTFNVGDDVDEVASASAVSLVSRAVQITSGDNHNCALMETNAVKCWGLNAYGSLGIGNTSNIGDDETPVGSTVTFAGGFGTAVKVAAGGSSTCAVSDSAVAQCWGFNNYGQLGDGTTTYRTSPVALSGSPLIVDIKVGGTHTLAVDNAGQMLSWGRGADGQLGLGTISDHSSSQVINGWMSLIYAAGQYFSCALNSDLFQCWGLNTYGQLGVGNTTSYNSPLTVSSVSANTVTSIAAGFNHACAIISGDLKCWGENTMGQLGLNSSSGTMAPMPVVYGTGVLSAAAGLSHTCAIRADGGLYCWGEQGYGQLGTGEAIMAAGMTTGQMEARIPIYFY